MYKLEDFIDYRKGRDDPYKCPGCDYETVKSDRIRIHIKKKHPEILDIDLEYDLICQRYPDMCIDDLILRYLEKEETMITLLKKKILPKKFFETIGIIRTAQEDKGIMSVISRRKKYYKESAEYRFEKQYLKRETNKMDKLGLPELIPAVTALRTIQFKQRQAKKAKEIEEKA